jgi:O-antigen/teichoic acid export membrane protein
MYVVAARLTSPASYGLVVASIALGTAAVGLIDFGSNTLWVRELARDGLSPRTVLDRAVNKVGLGWLLAVVWGGLCFTVLPTHLLSAGAIGAAILTNQTAQVFLRGQGRADVVAVTVVLERAVGGVALAVLLFGDMSPLAALPLALLVGTLVSAVVAFVLGRPRGARMLPFKWQNPWLGARHFGLGVAAQTGSAFDLPLLGAVGGPAAAGLYGAVNRWTQPMGLLAGAFSSALTPYIANVGSLRAATSHIRRAVWLLFLAVLACVVIAIVAPSIVPLLVGSQFADAGIVLRILALGTIPAVLNQPLAGALQAVGRERSVALLIAVGVGLQLLVIAVFGAGFGAVGAAYAFLFLQSGLLIALVVLVMQSMNTTSEAR